jgi:hypothetical protein
MSRAFIVALLAVPALSTELLTTEEARAPSLAKTHKTEPSPKDVEHARVRPLSPLTQELVEEAQARSPTIRSLVKHIESSDVVVYATCDLEDGRHANGRIALHAVVGGFRYLVMRIRVGLSRSEHVATFGHELQHAVEIAIMPSIVDDRSLAQAYRQIGFLSTRSGNSLGFETVTALHVSNRVRQEFIASSERDPCDHAKLEPRVLAGRRATSVVD